MVVKVKSLSVKTFEKGNKNQKYDFSEMTYDEMVTMKEKVAEALGVNYANVIVTYEGRE